MALPPLVIINPTSASGRTRSAWPRVASDLRTHFGPFSCAFTEKQGDAKRLAAEAAREGRQLVIACGGDGTINEVANGILESGVDAELGILPSGTGGDFRRTLRLSTHTATAARSLRTGLTRRIDVGRVTYQNQDDVEDTRYFLGVASCGMSGQIIKRVKAEKTQWLPFDHSRWLGGRLTFAGATLQTTLASVNTPLVYKLDGGEERRRTVANFCIANARYFGGGMKIAPHALLDDGRFDIIIIGDLSPFEIIFNAHRLYTGAHLSMKQVHHAHATRVHLKPSRSNARVALEVDGELPGHLPATFEIIPKALRVRVPKN